MAKTNYTFAKRQKELAKKKKKEQKRLRKQGGDDSPPEDFRRRPGEGEEMGEEPESDNR